MNRGKSKTTLPRFFFEIHIIYKHQAMISHFFIVGFVALLMVVSLVYFYFENKRIRFRHLQKEIGFIEAFDLHSKQIDKRKKGLNTFDFLQYNLSEALIIQPEINI